MTEPRCAIVLQAARLHSGYLCIVPDFAFLRAYGSDQRNSVELLAFTIEASSQDNIEGSHSN